nr:MAG TPA: hypothetical protein [Caudoviricetes sp.]
MLKSRAVNSVFVCKINCCFRLQLGTYLGTNSVYSLVLTKVLTMVLTHVTARYFIVLAS